MKTPIKEIEARASKGPFTVKRMFGSRHIIDGEGRTICRMISESTNKDENAQLIAHKSNNFDALLEALEGAWGGIEDNRDNWSPNAKPPWNDSANIQITLSAGECQAIHDAIKDANEVEVQV